MSNLPSHTTPAHIEERFGCDSPYDPTSTCVNGCVVPASQIKLIAEEPVCDACRKCINCNAEAACLNSHAELWCGLACHEPRDPRKPSEVRVGDVVRYCGIIARGTAHPVEVVAICGKALAFTVLSAGIQWILLGHWCAVRDEWEVVHAAE